MKNLESDAFVFFGATGDLAYQQIFPALQAMIAHGHFDIPIIGVAKPSWSLDQLRARAQESLEKHGGVDSRAFAVLSARLQYVSGDYGSPETFRQLRKALGVASRPLYYLAIPPDLFSTVAEGLANAECDKGHGWLLKNHSAVTLLRRRRSIEHCLNLFQNQQFFALTITLAKSQFKTCCTSVSPTHSSSPFGTATMSRVCRSRWLKILASAGGEHFMKSWARSAMSFKTTC
jgi:hypothetical protein